MRRLLGMSKGRAIRLASLVTVSGLALYNGDLRMVEYHKMTDRDINGLIANPMHFKNTVIILNKELLNMIPDLVVAKYCIYEGEQSSSTFSDYDIIAINSNRLMLLKVNSEVDLLRLQNFLSVIPNLRSKNEAIDMIEQNNAKIIMSYIPQDYSGDRDVQQLDTQFRELRYLDVNRNAQYYLIQNKEVAEQFGMSNNDVGEIYVVKSSSKYNKNESSFLHQGREYCMDKVERDIDTYDSFILRQERNVIVEQLTNLVYISHYQLDAPPHKPQSLKQWSVHKMLKKISHVTNPYVNYIQDRQQMESLLLMSKQMGVQYLLTCHQLQGIYYHLLDNDESNKLISKLINLKKSLDSTQQHQIMIVLSNNDDILREYFGIVSNSITDTIRLIQVDSHQSPQQNIQLNHIQLGESINPVQKDMQNCKRYSYDGKITVNRLKQFITHNLQSGDEYYEQTSVPPPQNNFKIMTSKSLQFSDLDLVYFYKPGCASCGKVSRTLEQIAPELRNQDSYKYQNLKNFRNIQFIKYLILVDRYNILNESPQFASPIHSPMIVGLNGNGMQVADLIRNRIAPNDNYKMTQFLSRFIDSL